MPPLQWTSFTPPFTIARGEGNLAQLYVERAEGSEMWDVEGNRYIDFASGIAVCNTGHTHPKVTEAVIEQVKRFSHTCVMVTPYDSAVRLAEQLNELAPGPTPKKINLCNHRRRSRRERRENRARSYGPPRDYRL